MGGIDRVRDGYAAMVARLVRVSLLVLVLVAGRRRLATGWLFKVTPTGFLPEEDQGAFMAQVQLPEGASVNRTLEVVKQVETHHRRGSGHRACADGARLQHPRRRGAVQQRLLGGPAQALRGAHDAGSQGRCGDRPLRRPDHRHPERPGHALQPAAHHRTRHRRRLRVSAGRPPGPSAARNWPRSCAGWCWPPIRIRRSQRVFSTWATDNPQVFLDIDREKAQTLGVQISDIFTALQATLGGYYVNDFNKFGRVWQVQVQGEETDRQQFDDVYRIHVRNSQGRDGPDPCASWRRS